MLPQVKLPVLITSPFKTKMMPVKKYDDLKTD